MILVALLKQCSVKSFSVQSPVLDLVYYSVYHTVSGSNLCCLYRFYIESISYLKDNATIELFFLNAKSCIYKASCVCVCVCGGF